MRLRARVGVLLLLAAPLGGFGQQAAGAGQEAVPHAYADGVPLTKQGVSAPQPTFMPDPEFSEESRKKKIAGACLVELTVDTEGIPQNVHLVRSLAVGQKPKLQKVALSLDEKALEAVRQYRFKPAMRDGKPVAVVMRVEVNFKIF